MVSVERTEACEPGHMGVKSMGFRTKHCGSQFRQASMSLTQLIPRHQKVRILISLAIATALASLSWASKSAVCFEVVGRCLEDQLDSLCHRGRTP